ncbi:MAG: hypothetical protein R3C03_19820 [Pirellulaceae bacterium]
MNNRLPELTDESVELWIEALVANELMTEERQCLMNFLEQNSEYWQACAVRFLDEQFMTGQDVTQLLKGPHDDRPVLSNCRDRLTPTSFVGNRNRTSWLVAIATCLVGLILGAAAMWNWQHAKLIAMESQQQVDLERVQLLGTLLDSERMRLMSLSSIFPANAGLIEIENSPTHAVYLTDREIPNSIIDSFVAAGHQVEIRPYQPTIETDLMQSLVNPVLQIEVEKNVPFLLVQGDTQ